MIPKALYQEVLKKNLPEAKEKKAVKAAVDAAIKKIQDGIKKRKINALVSTGGSYAKGTILKNDFDCDIFVRFALKYKNEDLSQMLEPLLKPLQPDRIHGSRDYFQVKKKGVLIEIVPVLKISSAKQAVNVTDCSMLHVSWIKNKMQSKSLANEIILTKLFMKGIGVYGAESYISGFSGHVIDILVAHHGSFEKLLKAVARWKPPVIIDIEKHGKIINRSKTNGPLTVVDPIQPLRNAAAAVGVEKFNILLDMAKRFLKSPKEHYFTQNDISIDALKKRKHVLVLEAAVLKGKKDVIGCKLLKVYRMIKNRLEEFNVVDSGWIWQHEAKAYFWYELKKQKLNPIIELIGPPIKIKDHVASFKKKHKGAYKKGTRMYARVSRGYTSPQGSLKDDLSGHFMGNVAGIKII